MSWLALGTVAVGAAVSAGGAAYSSSQAKKAAKTAAGGKPGTFTPELLDDPAQIDPMTVLQTLYSANGAGMAGAVDTTKRVNSANYKQAMKFLNKIQPQAQNIQNQIGNNALSYAKGELPSDVQGNITRMAAERGIQGGFGFGSQGASGGSLGNLNLRNLGLTSLDLSKYGTQLGMQVNAAGKALLPQQSMVQDWLMNPAQALGIAQFNTGAQNQFALQNNQTTNNALAANVGAQNLYNQNVAQANATAQMMQGQAVAQAASSIGGGISSFGTSMGSGATAQQPGSFGGTYMGTGNQYGLPTNQPVYRPQLA